MRSVNMLWRGFAVVVLACTLLAPSGAAASVVLLGDPGAVGGSPQTMVIPISAGTLAADMTDFLIHFHAGKFIQFSASSTFQFNVDITWSGSDPASVLFLTNSNMGVSLLDENNIALLTIPGGGSGAFSAVTWSETSPPFLTNFLDPFYGFDWVPVLDVAGSYSSFPGLSVDHGTITISFLDVQGQVGVVPEPSTMLLLGSGLVGLVGYGRRRLKK